MEKSVVDWLVDKLFDQPTLLQEQVEWIEKAKEMEREQMLKEKEDGYSSAMKYMLQEQWKYKSPLQNYIQTFKPIKENG